MNTVNDMDKLLLFLLTGTLIYSSNALEGCENSDLLQCVQHSPPECQNLLGLGGSPSLEIETNETDPKVLLRNTYMTGCN